MQLRYTRSVAEKSEASSDIPVNATLELHTSDDRQTLKARVLDTLVDEIMLGTLAPGDKLSEGRLAKTFGVSRMPVREALIELSRRGMVRVVPQVGTFVTELSTAEVVAQLEVREALEVQAARLLAERATEPVLTKLQTLLQTMQDAAESGNARTYVALDEAFHATIMQATQNPALNEHYRILTQALHREYLSLVVSASHGRMSRSLAEHQRVMECLTAGDVEAAEAAMREHVGRGREELRQALEARAGAKQ